MNFDGVDAVLFDLDGTLIALDALRDSVGRRGGLSG
jgi:FMN phosphatase YigB (HAD superfamily)